VGACLGAQFGVGTALGVPAAWIGQLKHGRTILAMARALVQLRAPLPPHSKL